ncbi:MAG: cupin domain-containing protein [Bacilli bacterium]|nr:cupin domain-containing protein [Bacilli bacterium]MBN2877888.1 cupin domain-containing protein [Bacilli bacterium]
MVGNTKDLISHTVTSDLAKTAAMKVLVSPKEGWEGYVMRVVEVGAFGYTPKHSHPWPHINYVIEGTGELEIDGVTHSVEAGAYAYVPGNSLHQFRNAGEADFRFICIVPEEGHIL